MCQKPVYLKFRTGSEYVGLPCGKCPECLQTKGNEFAVRVVREAVNVKEFWFVTLTYSDENLPLLLSSDCIDPKHPFSNKIIKGGDNRFLNRRKNKDKELVQEFYVNAEFTKVTTENGRQVKRYLPYHTIYGDVDCTIFPSVCNSDFQKCLKRFRKQCGSPFKYSVTPEYGGHTFRPHYHILLFGLNKEEVGKLCEDWQKHYGFTFAEKVDGSMTDISKVAKYVGSYTFKGKYDLGYIKRGFCKKPHRLMSQGFGFGDLEEFKKLESYYKCEDIYGPYDVNDEEFVEKNKETLGDDILRRRYYMINGFKYPLPSYITRKIFYNYEIKTYHCGANRICFDCPSADTCKLFAKARRSKSWQKTYVPSPVQKLVTDALFKHLRDDADREFGAVERRYESYGDRVQEVASADVFAQKDNEFATEAYFINKIIRDNKI